MCRLTCLICFVDPAENRQPLASEDLKVNNGTSDGRVAIDFTIGKATEFRFVYQGIPINVVLRNPRGDKVDVRKEEDANAIVFKPEGLAEVKTLHIEELVLI